MDNIPNMENSIQLKNALLNIRQSMPEMIQYQIYKAKLKKEYFDALIEQGFSESQALELCKTSEL